ncbi:MAG TPA: histidine kinase [Solirubrobacteraceae bacterium]|nr:histidine kinase [Solirubrobacteraceae bacterium]
MSDGPASERLAESERVAEAHARAQERLRRQRSVLRPVGWAVALAVLLGAFNAHPAPALHGRGLGVALVVAIFVVTIAVAIRDGFIELPLGLQAGLLCAMGGAGVALAWLQPKHATELAAGAAVWMAVARLPLVLGAVVGAAITIALGVGTAVTGGGSDTVLAATLLCVILALIAHFMKQARQSQDRTEELLAQLEDARDEQAQAAAVAERSRIAGELHDVLAHSLSGAAIQLQGARMLAARDQASPEVSEAIARAGELVRDGLSEARQAVGALRGDELPGVSQLAELVDSFRHDMNLNVTFTAEDGLPALATDAGLALYRGTQEALTNVARYAPGAKTDVTLRHAGARAILTVENTLPAAAPVAGGGGLAGVGGGRGLSAMRERVTRAGGALSAGPTESGWRVELEVPA